MKSNIVLISLVISCLSSLLVNAQNYPPSLTWNGCNYNYNGYLSPDNFSCPETEYRLHFADEFNDTTLNSEKWGTAYPWGRALHSKFSGTGWERQYYKNENVYLSDGQLHLLTKVDPGFREPFPPTSGNIFFNYTSGMVFSKQQFNKGKFEARCKIPSINGLWPAFWLYGFCAQEIDIFEFTNNSEESDPSIDAGNVIMTYHKQYDCYNNERGHCGFGNTLNASKDLSKDFHVYSVEWDDYKIIWKLDGKISREVYKLWVVSPPVPEGPLFGYAYPIKNCQELQEATRYSIFPTFPSKEHSMHVIFNTAVLLERASNAGALPEEFLIDYVRVYELIEKPAAPDSSNNTIGFEAFPNPSSGSFTINFTPNNLVIEEITMLNLLGQSVEFEYSMSAGAINILSDNGNKGIHYLQIKTATGTYNLKVIFD